MRFKKNKGFTLIEIIVVTVILAVLMAVAVPSVMSYIHEADDDKYVAVARAAFLNARNGFVHEYAVHGKVGNDEYHTLQFYVGTLGGPNTKGLKKAEEEIGPRKDYGNQVQSLYLCKMKLTPSKNGIASMTVGIEFEGRKDYKLVTIDANNKVTVGKDYLKDLTKVTSGKLS